MAVEIKREGSRQGQVKENMILKFRAVSSKFSKFCSLCLFLGCMFFCSAAFGSEGHPVLAIGAAAPDFALPGVDGKTHKLSEYASAKVLAVVFECNSCPISELYESRIEKLYQDYKSKGVALVAINPNNPNSVRLDEESFTDVTDSLDDMKERAEFRHLDYPYLYDGDKQTVAMKYGPAATPQIFIFDQAPQTPIPGTNRRQHAGVAREVAGCAQRD